jgi:hypothetical protein
MLDSLKLCFTGLNLILIFLILGYLSLCNWLCCSLGIWLATLCRSSFRIWFSWSWWLSWCFLFLLLLVIFFALRRFTKAGKLSLLTKFLQFYLKIRLIEVFGYLFETIWNIGGLIGRHQNINSC